MKKLLFFLLVSFIIISWSESQSPEQHGTTDTEISDLSSLEANVAVVTGSSHDQFATKELTNSRIFRYESYTDIVTSLHNRKSDYIILDIPMAIESQKKDSKFIIVKDSIFATDIALVFPRDRAKLQKEFNDFVKQFKSTQEYKDLKERWHTNLNVKDIPEVKLPTSGPILRVSLYSLCTPNVLIVNNKITGFETELIKHFAKTKGYQLKIKDCNIISLISDIATNKADIGAAMLGITEERKKQFLFSDPHSQINICIASYAQDEYKNYSFPKIPSHEDGQAMNIDDTVRYVIGNKNVAVLEGAVQEVYLSKLIPHQQILMYKEWGDVIPSILNDKSQLILMHQSGALCFVKENPSLEIILDNFESCSIAYGINKNNKELKDEVNSFLKEFDTNNRIAKLNQKWKDALDNGRITDIKPLNSFNKTLKVGTSGLSIPFTFVADDEFHGLDIEILYHFCNSRGYNIEFTQMPFGSLITALNTGKIDIIANSLMQTSEREEKIDFSTAYSQQCYTLIRNRKLIDESIVDELSFWQMLVTSFENNIIKEDRYILIMEGLYLTIIISFFSLIWGTILGMIICFMSMHKSSLLKNFAKSYINIIRGTPVLVLLMINFYVVFAAVSFDASIIAIISFAMNFAAYVSEMFRSSIESIDKGQREAGLAMGFTSIKTFIYIIAPQAIKRVIPIFKGEAISLVKMTSIVGYIAVQDITKVSDIIRSRTFDAFFPLIVSAILYFIISYIFSRLIDLLATKTTKQ